MDFLSNQLKSLTRSSSSSSSSSSSWLVVYLIFLIEYNFLMFNVIVLNDLTIKTKSNYMLSN